MKKQKLNEMSVSELELKLIDNQEAMINLRFQKSMGQLEQPLEIRNVRKEIAQIKTILREFELEIRQKELTNE